MPIKSFSIRNYKNLSNLQLENLARVNLIIGENNIGKSALLEAIAISVYKDGVLLTSDDHVTRFEKCEFVKAYQIDSAHNAELLGNVALISCHDEELIKALRIIDPRIEKIGFLRTRTKGSENKRIPYVVYKDDPKKNLFSSMVSGLNRIIAIVLSLLNSKGGVLLIDEFENGLHYTVQSQLWKMIGELAEKLDVQVFATTHSSDCIRSFVKSLRKDVGLVIRLQKMKGGISPVYFDDYKEVLFALDNDIDIR